MKKIILILFVFLIVSCDDSIKFDSKKWKPVESGLYGKNYRKKMVFDLVNNELDFGNFANVKGTSSVQVEKLIDKPYRIMTDTIPNLLQSFSYYYHISEKFDYGIDPNGGMTLQLVFDKDSTLVNWKINEYWNRP